MVKEEDSVFKCRNDQSVFWVESFCQLNQLNKVGFQQSVGICDL